MFLSVAQTPRAFRSSRVFHAFDDPVSSPRDRSLAKVLIKLSTLALLPRLGHMLVCTHLISPAFRLPVLSLRVATTQEDRSIKLVPTEYRTLGSAHCCHIRSRYAGRSKDIIRRFRTSCSRKCDPQWDSALESSENLTSARAHSSAQRRSRMWQLQTTHLPQSSRTGEWPTLGPLARVENLEFKIVQPILLALTGYG